MKTLLTSILAILVIASASTQTKEANAEHMIFKGVPIDGTLSDYVAKMKAAGFTHIGTEDGIAMLKGEFATYKDCTIGVMTLKGKDLVSKIAVIFPSQDKWEGLSNNYFNLKELLTEKYGEPSESVETFQTYSQPDDDRSKMHEVLMDRCEYYSVFTSSTGTIELSIGNQGGEQFVRLSYTDKINSQIIRDKALGDL